MFDYVVIYKVNGEIKDEVISFEEFIDTDFINEFFLDELELQYGIRDIEILDYYELFDKTVDVYSLVDNLKQ